MFMDHNPRLIYAFGNSPSSQPENLDAEPTQPELTAHTESHEAQERQYQRAEELQSRAQDAENLHDVEQAIDNAGMSNGATEQLMQGKRPANAPQGIAQLLTVLIKVITKLFSKFTETVSSLMKKVNDRDKATAQRNASPLQSAANININNVGRSEKEFRSALERGVISNNVDIDRLDKLIEESQKRIKELQHSANYSYSAKDRHDYRADLEHERQNLKDLRQARMLAILHQG